jgi:DNA-binding LacI/PurR family transcriptional regulator
MISLRTNPTICDISSLAKVSIAAVSRILNNEAGVREATRLKVIEAMSMLRYRFSQSTKALKNG